jgi:hypothetical protein
VALVQTREQASFMEKGGVVNTLKEKVPDLLALWGGSGLRACPNCGLLLSLPTPQAWANGAHTKFDFGLGAETKTLADSDSLTLCSVCGAACVGEPGTFGAMRSVSGTVSIATGETGKVAIRRSNDTQPVVYAGIYPDHIELDFPICGPACSKAMQAELKRIDLDEILDLVKLALAGKETWGKTSWA